MTPETNSMHEINETLGAALAYAKMGYSVFPLVGKVPLPKSHGCLDATVDEKRIKDLWGHRSNLNVGMRTGLMFFVLDIDPKDNGDGWFLLKDLPATQVQETGSGGKHYLFRVPDKYPMPRNSQGKNGGIHPGVDIRGQNGYIVVAPSIHPETGKPYSWQSETGMPDGEPALAPDWLMELALKNTPASNGGQEHKEWRKLDYIPDEIASGNRHSMLLRIGCSLRSSYGADEATIRETLAAVNRERCKPPKDDSAINIMAKDITRRYPAGRSSRFGGGTREMPKADSTATATEETTEKLAPNELAKKILEQVTTINVAGNVYHYGGTHWELKTPDFLKSLALLFDSDAWSSDKRRREVASFIGAKTYTPMVRWRNLEDYEIPVGNGVVDIRSMSIRDHRPTDYLQTCIPVAYEPSAQCPKWLETLRFFWEMEEDQERAKMKVNAIQEFFGYCLMSHAKYKKALLCQGPPDSGKSTISQVLRLMVGAENVCGVPLEDLGDPRKRAPLLGKMANVITEFAEDRAINAEGFKSLVGGGDALQFDGKWAQPVMDQPAVKFVLFTNHKPRINDSSAAMFNRMLMVNFSRTIPKHEQDRNLTGKLAEEISGILLWSLFGAQRLLNSGGEFTDPGSMDVAEYRLSENPLVDFMADKCEEHEGRNVLVIDLLERYNASPYRTGHAMGPKRFKALLESAGFALTDRIYVGGRRGVAVSGVELRLERHE